MDITYCLNICISLVIQCVHSAYQHSLATKSEKKENVTAELPLNFDEFVLEGLAVSLQTKDYVLVVIWNIMSIQ